MRTLFHNARILKMDGTPIFFGDLVVQGNRIIYVGDNPKSVAGQFDSVIECDGNVIMPGFKNAHAHSAMTFLRSKSDDTSLHDWLFKIVFPHEAHLTPDDVYNMAKVAYLECLTSGITACFEQYFYPLSSKKAAEDIGMRLVLLGVYNKDFFSEEALLNIYNKCNDNPDSLVKYCFGIHAEYTTSEEEIAMMKKVIYKTKSPFYVHISETESEVNECINRHGVTPVKYFADAGLFKYGGGGYHCCYFNEDDMKIWKKHHLSIVTCYGSNTKLASGIAPIDTYLKKGFNIAIGTDGPASNNCLDMFKEMALISSIQKVMLKDPAAIPAEEILKMATVNGAKAMGLNDADTLEVGKFADIIMIDLKRPNMQPINNIIKNIVYSGSKDNIKLTMINGKILYNDGKFYVNEPIEEIYKKCQESTDRLDKETQLDVA